MLAVTGSISIPDSELKFTFARSSGPGGQNVNKVSSKATLRFRAVDSPSLPPDVRQRLLSRYQSRLTKEGELIITSQESRDQPKNIDSCLAKLREMILSVATPPKKRRPTKRTKGSQVRRLTTKKKRSQVKEGRRGGWNE